MFAPPTATVVCSDSRDQSHHHIPHTMLISPQPNAFAHLFEDSSVRIDVILVEAIYCVPIGRQVSVDWLDKLKLILNQMQTFHQRTFGCLSLVCFNIRGPLFLPHPGDFYRSHSDYWSQFHSDINSQNPSCLPIVFQSPSFPTTDQPINVTIQQAFLEWGLSTNQDDLKKFFVYANCPEDWHHCLKDILESGGCCGGNCDQTTGFGVMTEEAWKHPEIKGTCVVAYHEGIGHPLRLPHPYFPHRFGIMSQAMYSGKDLDDQQVYLEPELISRMIHDPDFPTSKTHWSITSVNNQPIDCRSNYFLRVRGFSNYWIEFRNDHVAAQYLEIERTPSSITLYDRIHHVKTRLSESCQEFKFGNDWTSMACGHFTDLSLATQRWRKHGFNHYFDRIGDTLTWKELHEWVMFASFNQVYENPETRQVILFDPQRKLHVKLTPDTAFVSDESMKHWQFLSHGDWEALN